MNGPLGHSKACELEDFAHPELVAAIHEVFPHELARFGPEFPRGHEYRKYWEVAMAVRALRAAGVLHERAEVLWVAAGSEPTIFWLTNLVRRVFATDLYLDAGIWSEFADTSMLGDPALHWPGAWNPRRLVVQHMDALELRYEDASFDAVFSSSSVEHFGGLAEVRRSMQEAFRVLKPGGVLTLATELLLEGPSPGVPHTLMLDADEIHRYVIGDLAWELLGPLDLRVSAATRASEVPAEGHVADIKEHFGEHGRWLLHRLRFRRYPQLVLRLGEHLWTSVHLTLRKTG